MRILTLITGLSICGTLVGAAMPAIAQSGTDQRIEVREEPVAGQYDKHWYNYRSDILEADKELKSDLRRATDDEDIRDAWEEYKNELIDADKDYVEEMRDRNYRVGRVTIGN
ncbi:hypothetical protein AB1K62_05440 [Parasphingorhabdus sp. JC815]|uniref:hypothetical protein n=1 Tax=Parasphingorhabdus sp. JC815 TaxID=3232140 RepID=UPI00345833EC